MNLRAYSTALFECPIPNRQAIHWNIESLSIQYSIFWMSDSKTQGILLNTASLSIQYNCFSIFLVYWFWFSVFGFFCFIVMSQKWLKIICFSMCFSPFNCESAVLYAQEFKKHVFFYVFVPRVYQKRCTVCTWFQKTLVLQCVSIVFLMFFAIGIAKMMYCLRTN